MAWHSVYLLYPHDNVHDMAAKIKKRIGLIITNSQVMVILYVSYVYEMGPRCAM